MPLSSGNRIGSPSVYVIEHKYASPNRRTQLWNRNLKKILLMLIKQKYGISKPHATAIFLVAVADN